MNLISKYIIHIGIVFFLSLFTSQAQQTDTDTVLQRVNDFYKNTSVYTIDMNYNMFKVDDETKPIESYKGTYIKKKNYSKLDLLNSIMVQNNSKQIVIDHGSKAISYTEVPKGTSSNPVAIKNVMDFYKISCVDEYQQEIVYHLELKNKATPTPYYKVNLYINKPGYFVSKQELFFSSKFPFESEDGTKEWSFTKLCITMQVQKSVTDEILYISDVIATKQGAEKQLTEAYKNYQLVDHTK